MATQWNNKEDRFNLDGHEGNYYQEHNESMVEFRKSHANITLVNEPRLDEAALLGNLELLHVNHIIPDNGGTILPISTDDWMALGPMWKVVRYKWSNN